MIIYRKARKNELNEISTLLTDSFYDYNFFNIYKTNDNWKQYKFIKSIQDVNVKTTFKKQIILVGIKNEKIVSVSLLKSPSSPSINIIDYLTKGGIKILLAGGIKNSFGFLGMSEQASSICDKLNGNIWYLNSLAVTKSIQGQGIGSKMLQDCIIPYIKKRGGGILTLITNIEINRIFYKRNGFEEFHKMIINRNNKVINNWSYRLPIS